MKLNPDDKEVLEGLYVHFAVATDQLRRNPVVLGRIRAAFNRMTDRDDGAAELLRYMINQRKNKNWPKLGDRAKKFEPALRAIREIDGVFTLCGAYERRGIPLDEYLFRPELGRDLSQRFGRLTSRVFPAQLLVAALMQLRKRGLLPCVYAEQQEQERTAAPFADIEEVDRQHRRRTAGG